MQIKNSCWQTVIFFTKAAVALGLLGILFGAIGMTTNLWADDVEKLDEQLESLLLDDLKSELPPEALKEPAGGKPKVEPSSAEEEPAGEDVGAEGENPLSRIGQQMRKLESRLAGGEAPEETEQLQDKVVTDLAALIKQAQQQQKQKSQSQSSKSSQQSRRSKVNQPKANQQPKPGAGNANSKKPAADSTARQGQADAAEAERQALQDRIQELWGHLPQRAREQMLQSTWDKFLPKYEVLIEKYFRRLADDSDEAAE